MIDEIRLQVEQLRALVQADGADLEFLGFDEISGTVQMRLLFDDATCLDCVLPRDFLEQAALRKLQRSLRSVSAVRIADPRDRPC